MPLVRSTGIPYELLHAVVAEGVDQGDELTAERVWFFFTFYYPTKFAAKNNPVRLMLLELAHFAKNDDEEWIENRVFSEFFIVCFKHAMLKQTQSNSK